MLSVKVVLSECLQSAELNFEVCMHDFAFLYCFKMFYIHNACEVYVQMERFEVF